MNTAIVLVGLIYIICAGVAFFLAKDLVSDVEKGLSKVSNILAIAIITLSLFTAITNVATSFLSSIL